MFRSLALIAVALLITSIAYGSSHQMPAKFRFITSKTTLQQVIDKVGPYSRVRGSGMLYYQWDLADGSAVLVLPEWPFEPKNRIRHVEYFRNAKDISLHP